MTFRSKLHHHAIVPSQIRYLEVPTGKKQMNSGHQHWGNIVEQGWRSVITRISSSPNLSSGELQRPLLSFGLNRCLYLPLLSLSVWVSSHCTLQDVIQDWFTLAFPDDKQSINLRRFCFLCLCSVYRNLG